jgi:BMFP domain-containing protein YqiC
MKSFLKNLLSQSYENFSKKIYSDYYQSIEEFSADVDKNFKQMLVANYSEKAEGLNASISSFL